MAPLSQDQESPGNPGRFNPDLPDKLGGRGLLHLPLVDRGTFGMILPVALRNVRSEDRQVVYGLEFGPLLAHQTRKLEAINDPD